LADLHHDPANVRKHDDRNLSAIEASLKTFGQVEPLVVQAGTGKVIGGNGRLEVLRRSGATEADVVELDIDDTKAAALAIALNRTAELATWDEEALTKMLESLPDDLQDTTGFSESDIDRMIQEMTPVVEDEAPEPLPEAVSRRGDVWTLGEHRLMCGDSTDGGDVKLCLNGERASICFTSPPYNAGGNPMAGHLAGSESKYIGDDDDKTGAEYLRLLHSFTDAALAGCASIVVNIQQLAGNKRAVVRWMAHYADHLVDTVVWDKQTAPPQMASNVLNSQHEYLVIMASEGASRSVPFADWHGTVSTVYAAPGQKDNAVSALHAATFPIHLPLWIMQVLCPKASSVYEPFSGSGTTIIACEQLKRRCFAIEIEPRYVDVGVRRWQKLTGKSATLEGKTFEEVAAERGVKLVDR